MSDDKIDETFTTEESSEFEGTVEYKDATDVAESHDEDVEQALERETDDGKGGAVVPRTNFESYATEGVETDDKEN